MADSIASPFSVDRPSAVGGAFASALGYRLRRAESPHDLQRLQALRFQVFNLELSEGLPESWATGLDQDRFDAVCQHLLVEHLDSGTVVGTYRLQTGEQAAAHHGYYCDQEFDLLPLAALRPQVLELGRACIAVQHRNFTVLSLLWRGIAELASALGARYLLGCSSLTSQDPALGLAVHRRWRPSGPARSFNASPGPSWPAKTRPVSPCASGQAAQAAVGLPGLGARIASPPAIDRVFRTIDFLTVLDLESPDMRQRRTRFGL